MLGETSNKTRQSRQITIYLLILNWAYRTCIRRALARTDTINEWIFFHFSLASVVIFANAERILKKTTLFCVLYFATYTIVQVACFEQFSYALNGFVLHLSSKVYFIGSMASERCKKEYKENEENTRIHILAGSVYLSICIAKCVKTNDNCKFA